MGIAIRLEKKNTEMKKEVKKNTTRVGTWKVGWFFLTQFVCGLYEAQLIQPHLLLLFFFFLHKRLHQTIIILLFFYFSIDFYIKACKKKCWKKEKANCGILTSRNKRIILGLGHFAWGHLFSFYRTQWLRVFSEDFVHLITHSLFFFPSNYESCVKETKTLVFHWTTETLESSLLSFIDLIFFYFITNLLYKNTS